MKKSLLLSLSLLSVFALTAADQMPALDFDPPPRVIRMDHKNIITLTGKNVEIVVPADAGLPAKWAGKELQSFLNQVLSAKIPVRTARSKNVPHAIILGDSALSRKAGVRVDKLGRDAFLIKTIGKDIYIAGRDDKKSNTEKLLTDRQWRKEPFLHLRGTIFGTYDFLERFADIRFYFYGPIGTIVPKKASLKIPKLDIFDRPDQIVRNYKTCRYKQEDWYTGSKNPVPEGRISSLRWRSQTRSIPNSHGIAHLGYVSRFGKSNPEYFALKKDGTRYNTWDDDFPGHICLSNPGFRNELFKDMVSGLSGEPPTKRGVRFSYKGYKKGFSDWMPSVLLYPGFFNIHLQDGSQPCQCKDCQKLLTPYKNGQPRGELIWEFTADMANRIKKAGFKAYVTQMAYHFYRDVPKVKLPDNVLVQVATPGPWASRSPSMEKIDMDLLRGWNKKLGKKVWLWNYILNGNNPKSNYTSPGAPQYTPKAAGYYYQKRAKLISGAFLSNMSRGSDYIHDVMTLYMAMKIMWNSSLNVEKLMQEYYDRMFLAASPEMKKFFEELEEIWVTKMRGQYMETALGPVGIRPTQYEMWTAIYSPARIAAWEKLFARAEKKVAKQKDALTRVRFMKKHFLDHIRKYADTFQAKDQRSRNLRAYAAPDGKVSKKYYLPRLHNPVSNIRPYVTIRNTGDALVFDFRVDDKKMNEIVYTKNISSDREFFANATFEVFLNPNGDRKTIYQVAVTPSGVNRIYHHPGVQVKKDPRIQTSAKVAKDHWTATIRVPFSALPGMKKDGFPVNFTYNSQRKNAKSNSELYSWSPFLVKGFLGFDSVGTLYLDKLPEANLVEDFDLQGLVRKGRRASKRWTMTEKNGGNVSFATDSYISGGQSLKCTGTNAKSNTQISHALAGKLKPNTRYSFSFYVRYDMDNNAIARARAWAGRNYFFPRKGMKGKRDWTLVTGEFKTGDLTEHNIKHAHLGFGLSGKGTFYIDHIVLQEIK